MRRSSRCCSSRCRIRSTSATSPRWRRPTRRSMQRLAGNSFFTAATVQRQNLLRGYPQLTGPELRQPAARRRQGPRARDHASNRRYSAGLSANLAFAARRVDGEPDGRSLRSRADVVADEPERAAVASQRRRRLRIAVRQVQAVPERRRRGRGSCSADGRPAPRSSTSRVRCSTGATCSSTAI